MLESQFVLVVDDDADIRDAISNLLEDVGHRAVGVANGQEALDLIRARGRPCVILLDVMMPIMNGADFRARQLADPQMADVPVVVITAGRGAAAAVPANAVLPKPIRAEDLLAVVEQYCRSGP